MGFRLGFHEAPSKRFLLKPPLHKHSSRTRDDSIKAGAHFQTQCVQVWAVGYLTNPLSLHISLSTKQIKAKCFLQTIVHLSALVPDPPFPTSYSLLLRESLPRLTAVCVFASLAPSRHRINKSTPVMLYQSCRFLKRCIIFFFLLFAFWELAVPKNPSWSVAHPLIMNWKPKCQVPEIVMFCVKSQWIRQLSDLPGYGGTHTLHAHAVNQLFSWLLYSKRDNRSRKQHSHQSHLITCLAGMHVSSIS